MLSSSQSARKIEVALCVTLVAMLGGTAREEVATNSTASPPSLPRMASIQKSAIAQPLPGPPGDSHLDKTPPRETVGLDLVRNGWAYNCMECHRLLNARWQYERPLNEHKDIRFEHGNNRFCLNCHHPTNRNAFVDYDGSEIAQANVVALCAKCHGTIYRDWQAGVHGRENGFWKVALGEKAKLRCIQCHDPHSPKFKPMQPLPPLRYPPRAAHPLDSARAHVQDASARASIPLSSLAGRGTGRGVRSELTSSATPATSPAKD